MKKNLRNDVLFWLALSVFITHYFVQMAGYKLEWADNWLDDVLCLPVVLPLVFALIRLHPEHRNTSFGWIHIGVAWLTFSVAFELVLPALSSNYTADWLDVIFYASGAVIWYLYDRMRAKKYAALLNKPMPKTVM